jgi:hypothetical protein
MDLLKLVYPNDCLSTYRIILKSNKVFAIGTRKVHELYVLNLSFTVHTMIFLWCVCTVLGF